MEERKLEKSGIDWNQHSFGKGKYRRKTWGFGKYDKREKEWEKEVYIRELSIVEGGLGCAVWDAAVIMSRWIWENRDLFKNNTVIELGSGCGLPGIVASFFADETVLTDYLPQVLENLQYNVSLNCGEEEESNEQDEDGKSEDAKLKVKAARVIHLNWDEIDNDPTNGEKVEPVDILIGSELTYSDLSVDSLIKVITKFMKRDGIFYEVLSDDRDGVSLFIEKIKKVGIDVGIHPVPPHMLGNYNTKQRSETYKLYSFRFPETRFPDMK